MIDSEYQFEKMLKGLLDEIRESPHIIRNKDPLFLNLSGSGSQKAENGLSSIQASIEDMRICVKYLLFDLDATRRENLYLKKLLEDGLS